MIMKGKLKRGMAIDNQGKVKRYEVETWGGGGRRNDMKGKTWGGGRWNDKVKTRRGNPEHSRNYPLGRLII